MHERPLACALDKDQVQARRAELLPGLLQHAQARLDVTDGFRFQFAPSSDTLSSLSRTIDAERQCCPFLRFELVVEPDAGPMWLTVTGPGGTRALLADLEEQ